MKSYVSRKLQVYNPQLLKDLAQFWGTSISKNDFQWLLTKRRYVKGNTEGNVKETKL